MRAWSIVAWVLMWMWFSVSVVAAIRLSLLHPDRPVGYLVGIWILPACFGVLVWLQARVVIDTFRRRRRLGRCGVARMKGGMSCTWN